MTGVEVQELLRKEVLNAGGVTAWAIAHKVDQASVSRALDGYKSPQPAVLAALGLKKKVEYMRVAK